MRSRDREGERRGRRERRSRSRSRDRSSSCKKSRYYDSQSLSSPRSSSTVPPRSAISDYILSAARDIQRAKEEEARKAKAAAEALSKPTKGRWESSDEESESEVREEIAVSHSKEDVQGSENAVGVISVVEKKEVMVTSPDSEWLQDLIEEDDDDNNNDINNSDNDNVKDVENLLQEENELKTSMIPIHQVDDDANTSERLASVTSTGEASTVGLHIPLFHGCRSVECYQRLNYIDEGTYGLVFRAKDLTTGEEVALKQIKFDSRHTSKVGFPITALRETNILLSLNHPNIVRVKEMVVGSSIDKIYMVMEYLDNDLKACMDMSKTPFSMSEVKRLMLQLLSAVNHMHQHWYIHRDLKTSNLLYSNKEKKLAVCDFGMARKYGSPLDPYTFEVITLWYRCPELLLGQRKYSTAVDIWSIGCIFAELLLRKPLFMGEGEIDQINKIFKVIGAPTEERWPGYAKLPLSGKIGQNISSKSKLKNFFPSTSFGGGFSLSETGFDLVSRLLDMNPETRISADDALKHNWFTEQPYPCPVELMPTFVKNEDE